MQDTKWYSLWLLGVISVIFVLQNISPSITASFALISSQALTHPWMFITHIFLHGSFSHLFYNMFALGLFGTILEKIIGSKDFVKIFFISGFVAGIPTLFLYSGALGASGAIFGIIGCLTVLRPRMVVYVGWFPMPMFMAAIVWVVGNSIGLFVPSGVGNAAHLMGLAVGLGFGYYYKKLGFGDPLSQRKEQDEVSDEELDAWESRWM